MECEVSGGNPTDILYYSWRKGLQDIINGQTQKTYTINELDRTEHTADFYCAAINRDGKDEEFGDGIPVQVWCKL